jgi:hypothetical protein
VLGDDPPTDVAARFDIVFTEMARQVTDNEIALRATRRLSLETPSRRGELLLRGGSRGTWIADALAPLRSTMPRSEFDRLVVALAVGTPRSEGRGCPDAEAQRRSLRRRDFGTRGSRSMSHSR